MAALLVGFRSCFLPIALVLKGEDLAFSVDVQDRRAVCYARLGVRYVEREAPPTPVLAVPRGAHSYGW